MVTDAVLNHAGREWGWVALRGVVAVLFGLMAVLMPGITLSALVLVWGAFALADGIFALVAGWRIRDQDKPLWPLILVGLTGIAAGIATFAWPGLTALVLLYIIAFWAVIGGCSRLPRRSAFARTSRTSGCTACRARCPSSSGRCCCSSRAPARWRWCG